MSCIGVWGSDLWVPRVPVILLLCVCFYKGYDVYQVCRVLECGVAIYWYHGYQLFLFCVWVFFVIGTAGTKYVVYRCVGERFMGTTGTNYTSSVCVFFVMCTTGTKYVLYLGVGVRFMGTTVIKYVVYSCVG